MFLQLFILVSLLIPEAYPYPVSMIVTYGKPIKYTAELSYIFAKTWEDCVIFCYNLPACVVAHSAGNPIACKIYIADKISEVKKLTSADDMLIAFKVANSGDICPIGDNPPTFGGTPSYGSASIQGENFPYVITFESGASWRINFNATLVCQYDWGMFTRPTTNWCIRVFGASQITYTQAQAQAYCETQNATLTGLESIAERDFVSSVAISRLGNGYSEFAGFWVDGYRKPECYSTGWENISYCTGDNPQQFSYTDKYLTNYAGYTWDPNKPDRTNDGVIWQNCIQVWIRNQATYPQNNYSVLANGAADDADCFTVNYMYFHLRGFACGKLPQVAE